MMAERVSGSDQRIPFFGLECGVCRKRFVEWDRDPSAEEPPSSVFCSGELVDRAYPGCMRLEVEGWLILLVARKDVACDCGLDSP